MPAIYETKLPGYCPGSHRKRVDALIRPNRQCPYSDWPLLRKAHAINSMMMMMSKLKPHRNRTCWAFSGKALIHDSFVHVPQPMLGHGPWHGVWVNWLKLLVPWGCCIASLPRTSTISLAPPSPQAALASPVLQQLLWSKGECFCPDWKIALARARSH